MSNYHLSNWPAWSPVNTVSYHLSQIPWEGKNTFYHYSYILSSSQMPPLNHQSCLSNWVLASVMYWVVTEYMDGFRMSVFVTNHGPSSFIQPANAYRKMPGCHVNCDQEAAAGFRKSYEVNKQSWKINLYSSSWCFDAYASHQWRNKFLRGSLSGYSHSKPSFLRCNGSLMAY